MGCMSAKAANLEHVQNYERQLSTGNADDFEAKYIMSETVLGKGSYALVRECLVRETRDVCAVKIVAKDALPEDERLALLEEVDILRHISHPNVVKLHDFYERQDAFLIVMEKLGGGELFDRIVQKQRYTELEAREIVKALLDGVRHLHDGNIVHRDIKPENLLLTTSADDASIKIADFGFAKKDVTSDSLKSKCGTPGFVAPEILKGMGYGTQVDVWSLGCIVYILLGGYPPFYDESQPQLFRKIKAGQFKFHREYWSHVSDDAKDLINKMITVNPRERITAHDALHHSWIEAEASVLGRRDIQSTTKELRKHNARRKLRAAFRTVIATNRMRRLISDLTKAANQDEKV
uniref:Protein kinase domain-containing protein n=1 Tax=Pinguiococcus pyrenoidosus TaxID=172671 RepID=A0A7R9Y8Y9_9STRA|mmetsp:Transcript_10061/g.38101  ORF Transcript_10061/g.38101 Transcript_10061/m.38101 type:complete len:350 (+) Transcript_10061:171-1220(+)